MKLLSQFKIFLITALIFVGAEFSPAHAAFQCADVLKKSEYNLATWDDKDLFSALGFLSSGASPKMLSASVVKRLRQLADNSRADLSSPDVIEYIYTKFQRLFTVTGGVSAGESSLSFKEIYELSPPPTPTEIQQTYKFLVGKYEEYKKQGLNHNFYKTYLAVMNEFELQHGSRIAAIKKEKDLFDKSDAQRDESDMRRGWGWKILPENDKAFNDPEYLNALLNASGPSGLGEVEGSRYFGQMIYNRFDEEFKANTGGLYRPVALKLTGSDANNYLLEIATNYYRQKYYRRTGGHTNDDGQILFFDKVYGAVSGKMKDVYGIAGYSSHPNPEFKISSPITSSFDPTDPEEIARLESLEAEALQQIREKANDPRKRVAAIFLESFVGPKANGSVYRPAFIEKLQKLCDELDLLIFSDEVYSGGGRTGKFFAFEHYPGFHPDFISFGKALQVSGVAGSINSEKAKSLHYFDYGNAIPMAGVSANTSPHFIEPILKSTQIMKRIRTDHLVENAKSIGEYLQRRFAALGYGPEAFRAFGVSIHLDTRKMGDSFGGYHRLMPFITLNKAQADKIFEEISSEIQKKKNRGY